MTAPIYHHHTYFDVHRVGDHDLQQHRERMGVPRMSTSDYTGPVLTTAATTTLTDTFLAEYERRIIRRAQYDVLKAANAYLRVEQVEILAEKFGLPWPEREVSP